MKKRFAAILFGLLLLLTLSACSQTLPDEGVVYGEIISCRREGFYVRADDHAVYLFELACGIDLTVFDEGDKLQISYHTENRPVAVRVLKVEGKYGTLLSVQSESFTVELNDGTALTVEYNDMINMDGLKEGDFLYVEYVKTNYIDGEHIEATSVLKRQT